MKNKVLIYNGNLIMVFYLLSNGGYIELSDEVWGLSVFYLIVKKDIKDF